MVSDDVLRDLLREIRSFVVHLDVTVAMRDDIISDTATLIARRLDYLATLDTDDARRWVRGTAFLVARNTRRSAIRRTAAWSRLRATTPALDCIQADDGDAAEMLAIGLKALNPIDVQLLIGQVWEGLTTAELATRHNLTDIAVRQRLRRARTKARQAIVVGHVRTLKDFGPT